MKTSVVEAPSGWVGLLTFVVTMAASVVQAAPEPPDRIERWVGLARLWAEVRVYHPWMLTRDIAWDTAMLEAIEKSENATTLTIYQAALEGLLARLEDPATRLVVPNDRPSPGVSAGKDRPEFLTEWGEGLLHIDIGGLFEKPLNIGQWIPSAFAAKERLPGIRVVIVDLRLSATSDHQMAHRYAETCLGPLFDPVYNHPLHQYVVHRGYRPDFGLNYTDYRSTLVTDAAPPAKEGGPTPKFIFLVDETSPVPPQALGLVADGRGTLVSTTPHVEALATRRSTLELPFGLRARVRGSTYVLPGNARLPVTVASSDELVSTARRLAKTQARRPFKRRARKRPKTIRQMFLRSPENPDWPEDAYPGVSKRILAAMRLWMIFEYYSPYRSLIDDWEASFRRALAEVYAAKDANAYVRALRRQAAAAGDGHVGLWSTVMKQAPKGPTFFLADLVEDRFVVVGIKDEAAAKKVGLHMGDEILTWNGRPIRARFDEQRPFISGSHKSSRDLRVARAMFTSIIGTPVEVTFRGSDGKIRKMDLIFSPKYYGEPPSSEPVYRKTSHGYGFVDLTRLTNADMEPMFDALGDAPAIIFDLRGYPQGTGWALGTRLNVKKARFMSRYLQPYVTMPESDEQKEVRLRYMEAFPKASKLPLYRGQVVVLMNEWAMSQAESVALIIKESTSAVLMGSPTHGADGEMTHASLPGGVRFVFTGNGIRHADDTQLQRVGVVPDIEVRPTIAGIRAGRDEVLERAIEYLKTRGF